MTFPAPPSQIADILTSSLESVFATLCDERYGGPISIERETDSPSSPATVRFRLHRTGVVELHADVEIRHVGGNMYDVRGTIEEGPSRSFPYCLPESAIPGLSKTPHLAREVASFLLDALEQRIGSERLRNKLRRRQAPPRPNRSGPRPSSSSSA